MIAVDTSTLSAYLSTGTGVDVDRLDDALRADELAIPLIVLTEALSAPLPTPDLQNFITTLRRLPVADGYWERAGIARRLLRSKGLRARLGDALIAQACIDAGVELLTRDSDFRHYSTHCGLKLA
jgi:predicted nucleic acid-binding protein